MNKIQEIRKKTKLTQAKFAEKYEIPVRTLQQWEQGISTPPAYVLAMIENLVDSNLRTFKVEDYRRPERTSFKVCIPEPFLNCERIYPIQQRKVKSLIDDASVDLSVKRIYIFGSSVTEHCHIGSDIDIYMEMDNDHNPITKAHSFEYDFWNNFRIDERLGKEIKEKGVVVYER